MPTKLAFNWHKFREGIVDEGIPLGGATIGAAIGHRNPLRGAALGYAAGGAASLGRSLMKKERPSTSQALLAGGALGYGLGGLSHAGLTRLTAKAGKGLGRFPKLRSAFHGHGTRLGSFVEEAMPATGATLGTGVAMGMMGSKDKKKTASIPTSKVIARAVNEVSEDLLHEMGASIFNLVR